MKSRPGAYQRAMHFLENEKAFHLGFLATEQPHPATSDLENATRRSLADGVRLMLEVDRLMIPGIRKALSSSTFSRLSESMLESARNGRRTVFSGCGATGRLCILLEASWRKLWLDSGLPEDISSRCASLVESIMTGGDYALVRSVESFEDHQEFGRKQTVQKGVSKGDTFVAVSEGGETSSVIGSALEAIDRGAKVFFVFNNPADLLASRIERSAKLIRHRGCESLEIPTGQMAIAGSTRLQAVSSELAVLGSALENTAARLLEDLKGAVTVETSRDPAAKFAEIVRELGSEENIRNIAGMVEFEEKIYSGKGLVTYFADGVLIDIFTDTTERAPTFMLPPFVKDGDNHSPQPWAFVKNPLFPTDDSWERTLGRKPDCLEWTRDDYISMGAPLAIVDNPPAIGSPEIARFRIGNEPAPERVSGASPSAAIAFVSLSDQGSAQRFLDSFKSLRRNFGESRIASFGKSIAGADWNIPLGIAPGPIMLWEHIAVKLVMNIVSTLTMVRMGRVSGNWMSYVESSNKKLIDRSARLVSQLCGIPYREACIELFVSIEEIAAQDWKGKHRPSAVQHTLRRLRGE